MAERQDTSVGVPRRVAAILDEYKRDMRLSSAGEAIEQAITLARTAPAYIVAVPIEHALSLCPDDVRDSPEDSVIRQVAIDAYVKAMSELLSEQASRPNSMLNAALGDLPNRKIVVVPITADGGALTPLTMQWIDSPARIFPMTHAITHLVIDAIREAVEKQQ